MTAARTVRHADRDGRPRPGRPGPARRRGLGVAAAVGVAVLAVAVAAPSASAAPPWLAPSELAAPQPTFSGSPVVGMADDGTTVAVFTQPDGAITRLYAAVRPPGGAFGAPVAVSDATSSAASPAIAVDPQGNATAAWVQASAVQAAYRPAGGAWGPSQPLSASDGTSPTVAAGPGGGAAVAWYSNVPAASQRAKVAVRAPGATTFASATNASSATGTASSGVFTPRVAMDEAGNVAAVWTRHVDVSGTSRLVVESAIKPAAAAGFTGTAESRSSTAAGNAGADPEVVMTPSGRAFAVWTWSNGGDARLEFADRPSGGAFSSAQVSIPATSGAYGPKAAIADDGTVALTWGGASSIVTSSVRSPGSAFSTPKPLSASGVSGSLVSIAISDSGDAVIAWPTGSSTDYSTFAARRRPGADAFGEVTEVVHGQVAAPPTAFANPDVALDAEGNGFVSLRRSAGSPTAYTPVAVGFDVVAPVLTGVSVPSTATVGTAVGFGVSATDRMSAPSFSWSFGDGTTDVGPSPSHAFGAPGVYNVTVTATDGGGNATQETRAVQVAAASPAGGDPGGTPTPGTTTPGTTKPTTPKAPRITRPKRLKVGSKLSVPATIKGATKLRFQWLRNGKAVKKATKRTYRVVRADRGKRIACRVTVRAGGRSVRLTTSAVKIPRR